MFTNHDTNSLFTPPFKAMLIVALSGERILTVVRSDGTPVPSASVYLSLIVRATAGSPNSSEASAYGIVKLMNAAWSINVDIVRRVQSGEFASVLERSRLVARMGEGVSAATRAATLTAALDFLGFLADVAEERLGVGIKADRYARGAGKFFPAFEKAKRAPSRDDSPREGLDDDAKGELARVISSQAECEAVWPNPYVALRNRTFIEMGLLEGHRRGELLAFRLPDINLETGEYWIRRRPNDAGDPRRRQPLVKGRTRKLRMTPSGLEAARRLIPERGKLPFAASHDFLFTTATGKPLSSAALNKSFRTFRAKRGFVGANFTPHILRYCWNDDFSAYADEVGLDPSREARLRKHAMGWRSGRSADTYTKRHDRAVARDVSLGIQARFVRRARRA